jgi:hypothetical protein
MLPGLATQTLHARAVAQGELRLELAHLIAKALVQDVREHRYLDVAPPPARGDASIQARVRELRDMLPARAVRRARA